MGFSVSDMTLRSHLAVTAYLVIGPRDMKGRRVGEIVKAAVCAGFTAVQLRAKEESAREQIALLGEAARAIEAAGAAASVPLLVDDRLDVALAAREMGVAVSGVHVGQKDGSGGCRLHRHGSFARDGVKARCRHRGGRQPTHAQPGGNRRLRPKESRARDRRRRRQGGGSSRHQGDGRRRLLRDLCRRSGGRCRRCGAGDGRAVGDEVIF